MLVLVAFLGTTSATSCAAAHAAEQAACAQQ
jgi:hypothetical protein